MTRRALRQLLADRLSAGGIENAVFEATQLLCHQFCCTPAQLLASQELATDDAAQQALAALAQRRLAGEPLQYLLGSWSFFGLPFAVRPGVLIPRSDTEPLVEQGLLKLQGRKNPAVLDLCCGSGCIGIAVAHARSDAQVICADLSDDALALTRENAEKNGVAQRVAVLRADALGPLCFAEPFDLILCNPPYLTPAEMEQLSPEVRREPAEALLGGSDGLVFYRAICPAAFTQLKPGGWLLFEVGYTQADAVSALLQAAGFTAIAQICDLCGMKRVVLGQK